ncbi:MAG TPA: nicotinate-nucleotide adenylyltransferase [Gemmatimonadales bacterium]|nr:nicotinate-nucleotide adenylyltransferase [Gemmatimonadales bacterium]
MATGVFGGSFDPVHHGHLIAADRAAEALGLDRVLFVPCRSQPLKHIGPVASVEHRCAMLRLALAPQPQFVLETFEADRDGPSYTVDTLRELRRRAPEEKLVLLLGSDAAMSLHRWRSPDEVARLAEIAVLTRPGVPETASALVKHLVATPAIEISASEIRARCLTGKSIRYLVPDTVANYIASNGLYR